MYSISGGSRIFLGGRGTNSQSGCANLFFPRKLHENETIWTPGGGGGGRRRVPGASPLDVPISIDLKIESDLRYDSL